LLEGTNIAVSLLTFTGPVTAAPPAVGLRVKLAVLSVTLVIGSEKFADTEEFSVTPVAAFAGEVADTVGGVVSAAVGVGVVPPGANSGGGSPAPPPQPNRPRLANSVAKKMPAEIRALILLPVDMRETLRNNLRDY
jgi:hypothetical protein